MINILFFRAQEEVLRENKMCEELDPVPLCSVRDIFQNLKQIVQFGESKKSLDLEPESKRIKVEC